MCIRDRLCAAPFSAEDVVRADRVNIMPETAKKKLPVEFYKECGEALAKETLDTDTIEDILKRFGAQCGSALSTEEKLYNAIIDDETFLKIKRYVGQPKRVSEISSYMGWSTADAERFVMVEMCIRDSLTITHGGSFYAYSGVF